LLLSRRPSEPINIALAEAIQKVEHLDVADPVEPVEVVIQVYSLAG